MGKTKKYTSLKAIFRYSLRNFVKVKPLCSCEFEWLYLKTRFVLQIFCSHFGFWWLLLCK